MDSKAQFQAPCPTNSFHLGGTDLLSTYCRRLSMVVEHQSSKVADEVIGYLDDSRSFLYGGSTGLFIYAYCFYYYVCSNMSGFMQTSFFFGYNACICYGLFLILGTVSFHTSLLFVRHIPVSQVRVKSWSLDRAAPLPPSWHLNCAISRHRAKTSFPFTASCPI
ncbi:hypothetical protein SAY86_025303 [Trapa natans]|uniref:Transmembrane 9 superfamily member n=1 Tax=Trapa natans TaxID=22666 RepID=A0AAN7RKL7_TRANT|nr:hypothetical protein SAY86_025303 [Trapa natans]